MGAIYKLKQNKIFKFECYFLGLIDKLVRNVSQTFFWKEKKGPEDKFKRANLISKPNFILPLHQM